MFDGSVHVVLDNVTISNGLEWSPDGSRTYYNDAPIQRIDDFDYDGESGLTGRRPFAEIPAEAGVPDGLTVDEEGVLDEAIEVPAKQVTTCAFGASGLDQLFITTSREGLGGAEDPLAGSLFRAAAPRPARSPRLS